ncbi:unknown [Prevotella sp. CAG:617]|nr:unknown [Prevotella sp. CAG:617]
MNPENLLTDFFLKPFSTGLQTGTATQIYDIRKVKGTTLPQHKKSNSRPSICDA